VFLKGLQELAFGDYFAGHVWKLLGSYYSHSGEKYVNKGGNRGDGVAEGSGS
jgi:hypothetical protein